MKQYKYIHDMVTGKIEQVELTADEMAEVQTRVAAVQLENDAFEAAKLTAVTEAEIDAAKTVNDLKALLKRMLR